MSAGTRFFYTLMMVLIPFAVAAAFHFSDWMGWPSLFVGGIYWLGCSMAVTEKKK